MPPYDFRGKASKMLSGPDSANRNVQKQLDALEDEEKAKAKAEEEREGKVSMKKHGRSALMLFS